MDNDIIFEGLVNFASAKDKFAIMLDGPWGSGKTYFIKNKVIPQLQETSEVVYFSVYGYETLSELKTDLMGQLFISSFGLNLESNNTKDAKNITDGLFSIFGDKLSAFKPLANAASDFVIRKQLKERSKKKSPVVIVDDLERISQNIQTSDFLGFLLTNIIEPFGYRVIIVGNSKEIIEAENGVDKPEKFKRTREKVISRIFPFTFDLKNIQNEFLEKTELQYLKDDSEWVSKILSEYANHNKNQFNLRTLEFILSTFTIIDKNFEKYWSKTKNGKKEARDIKRSAFANLFVIANEYREGRLTRADLPELEKILYTKNFCFMHLKDDEEKSKAEQITLRYHDDRNLLDNIIYTNEVNSAIFNGVFDAKKFVERWLTVFASKENGSYLSELAHFREMDDNQLKELQEKLLKESSDLELKSKDILNIINNFIFFDEQDIYFADEPYLETLLDAFDKKVRIEILQENKSFDESLITYFYDMIARNKKVMEKVQVIVESAVNAKHKNDTQRLLRAIFSDNYETLRNIRQQVPQINIFKAILDSKYLHEDLLVAKTKAPKLDQYIHAEYITISNAKDFHQGEVSDLKKLINYIEKFINSSTEIGSIDKFNLRSLLETLQCINTKFSE